MTLQVPYTSFCYPLPGNKLASLFLHVDSLILFIFAIILPVDFGLRVMLYFIFLFNFEDFSKKKIVSL